MAKAWFDMGEGKSEVAGVVAALGEELPDDVARWCLAGWCLGWDAKVWDRHLGKAVEYWVQTRDSVALVSLGKLPRLRAFGRGKNRGVGALSCEDVVWLAKTAVLAGKNTPLWAFAQNVTKTYTALYALKIKERTRMKGYLESISVVDPKWHLVHLYSKKSDYCSKLGVGYYSQVLYTAAKHVSDEEKAGRYMGQYARELVSDIIHLNLSPNPDPSLRTRRP